MIHTMYLLYEIDKGEFLSQFCTSGHDDGEADDGIVLFIMGVDVIDQLEQLHGTVFGTISNDNWVSKLHYGVTVIILTLVSFCLMTGQVRKCLITSDTF